MIVQIALNNCGTAYITAFTTGTKIQNILTQTFNALGMTMATFIGQNYGIGNIKRIRKGVHIGIQIGIGCSIFCIIFILLFLDPAISVFGTDVTDNVVNYTHYFMNCCMLGYIPLAFLFGFYGISFGHTAAWTLAAITLIPFYLKTIKEHQP